MEEIRRDIVGYEGKYSISNKGRVFSHVRNCIRKNVVKKSGYLQVTLRGEKQKHKLVHRLVGEAFINKEYGKDFINHKDGNKKNNTVENLEWCTNIENMKHFFTVLVNNGNYKKRQTGRVGGESFVSRKVLQTDIRGNEIMLRESISIAILNTGINRHYIQKSCNKGIVVGGLYRFEYVTSNILAHSSVGIKK